MVSVLIAYYKTTRVQIAALLYFLLAGALTQIPLFNYLGYEFSALLTIPTSIITGILTIQFMREHRMKPLTRRTWLYVIIDYLVVNLLLLMIPLIVISFNAFAIKNCAYFKGLSYYFLLPVITMFFSVALALIVGILFRKGIMMYSLFVMAILSHIVFVTYTQPQLFAFNFILGFFPGITYDETVSDIGRIVLYRQFTIIASMMLIALFIILTATYNSADRLLNNIKSIKHNLRRDGVLWGVIIVCFAIVGTGHIFRDMMGFEYSEQEIQNRLGRRSESNHFVIYYHTSDYSADEMRMLKAEMEFHYRKVTDVLKTNHLRSTKISLFIYPNSDWKQQFIGTSNTNIAKPWESEIHLTKSTLESTFRHELVHILAAEFGFPVIKASTRMGLNEGLAVAVDWDEGMFTPHQFAAALQRENGLQNTEQLFSYTGFATQSSSYAYLVSGSFVRYLIDRFGIERVQRVYPDGNFVLSFGESLQSLLNDWKAFLKTIDVTEIPTETVKTLFFQPSIFYKTCAREVAEQNQRAVQSIRVKNFIQAESEFSVSYNYAPTAYALRGIFQSMNSLWKPKEVIKRFADLSERSALRKNPAIMLLLADAYYIDREYTLAATAYRTVQDMNYSEPFMEASVLRLQFLRDAIEPSVFYSLYYGGQNDSIRLLFADSVSRLNSHALSLFYVKGLLYDKKKTDQNEMLKRIASESLPAEMKYFSLLRCADQLYSQGALEKAKSLYWQAKNFAPTAVLSDRLEEKIELCDFVSMEQQ